MNSITVYGLEYLSRALRELDTPDGKSGLQLSFHTAAVVDQPLFLDVIGAAVKAEGGTCVVAADCEGDAYFTPDPSSAPRVMDQCRDLASSMETALATAGASSLTIASEQDGVGGVRFLANGVADPYPGGQQRILGVLKALAVLCASGAELGALVYTDRGLDGENARALWDLLCIHVPAMGLCGLRRLLIVLDTASLDSTLYYSKPNPIMCLVNSSGCHRRGSSRETARHADELAKLSEPERPLILFLGAGTSRSSGLPLGDTLRNQALRRLLATSIDDDQLPLEFFRWLRTEGNLRPGEEAMGSKNFCDSLTLERVLREEFARSLGRENSETLKSFFKSNADRIGKGGKAVLGLRRIVERLVTLPHRRVVLVTLNFDTLLEDGLGAKIKVFRSDAEFDGRGDDPTAADYIPSAADYIRDYKTNGGAVPYLKLHGSIEDFDTIVASSDQTLSGLPRGQTKALEALYGTGRAAPLVYVGCSMRDLDLTGLLNSVDWPDRLDERWVAPLVDDSVRRFVEANRIERWKSSAALARVGAMLLEARAITDTADNFIGELADALGR